MYVVTLFFSLFLLTLVIGFAVRDGWITKPRDKVTRIIEEIFGGRWLTILSKCLCSANPWRDLHDRVSSSLGSWLVSYSSTRLLTRTLHFADRCHPRRFRLLVIPTGHSRLLYRLQWDRKYFSFPKNYFFKLQHFYFELLLPIERLPPNHFHALNFGIYKNWKEFKRIEKNWIHGEFTKRNKNSRRLEELQANAK